MLYLQQDPRVHLPSFRGTCFRRWARSPQATQVDSNMCLSAAVLCAGCRRLQRSCSMPIVRAIEWYCWCPPERHVVRRSRRSMRRRHIRNPCAPGARTVVSTSLTERHRLATVSWQHDGLKQDTITNACRILATKTPQYPSSCPVSTTKSVATLPRAQRRCMCFRGIAHLGCCFQSS